MKPQENSQKIQAIQVLEQNLNAVLMQKQTIELEINEINNAEQEISNSSEIYQIKGHIMIKSTKEKTLKDLHEKKKILELKLSSLEKQEKLMEDKASELKLELSKNLK